MLVVLLLFSLFYSGLDDHGLVLIMGIKLDALSMLPLAVLVPDDGQAGP